jgi:hypothetical protein
MVTFMGVFRKYWIFQKVLSVTSYKNGDKYKLTGMSNVKSEVTITKDHFTTFPSEMTLMYRCTKFLGRHCTYMEKTPCDEKWN